MNWVFMLREAWEANPDFWFEMSTWDGNSVQAWMEGLGVDEPGQLAEASAEPLSEKQREQLDDDLLKDSKALQYMADGQTYPPSRTAGWVQFGMWLLRPRVVREFRSHTTPLEPVRPYWMETVRAVDRVYASDVLKRFWRKGRLVPNEARKHPYQADVPQRYEDVPRWYLLETSVDPERPWGKKTNLPVFSLALVLGEKDHRRWLLYAHSPLKRREGVRIRIPDHERVTVDVPRAGAFYRIDEASGAVRRVSP